MGHSCVNFEKLADLISVMMRFFLEWSSGFANAISESGVLADILKADQFFILILALR